MGQATSTESWALAAASPVAADRSTAAVRHVRAVTRAAGSSFYWAMRVLPRPRREAMFAVYAFCREVDDIADGAAPAPEKRARLAAWREEIAQLYDGAPMTLVGAALAEPVRRYRLQREHFLAIVDGMEMDVDPGMRAPSWQRLESYCARVAGAVGLLSVRVFGAAGARADEFALALGSALQLTNILRDLAQDAALGRLYLPRELLARHGIDSDEPAVVLAHQALPAVCEELVEVALARYGAAEAALPEAGRRALRPAVVMMMSYRRLLEALRASGWREPERRVRVPKTTKIWIALRYGVL